MRSDAPLPRRRWLLLLAVVGLLGTLAAVPGAWARSTYGAEAAVDEPQYLLTAIAIAERGSLDIGPELDARRWREFHEAALPRQTLPDAGRRVSPHDPLLPLLLAGPVDLWGWRAARMTIAVVGGLLAVALCWTAVRRLGVRPGWAAGGSLVASASAPFVVYGSQVYPELPAALAVTLTIAAGLGPVGRRTTAGVVACVVALPWLSVKYVPVAAVLALLHLTRVVRADRRRLASATLAAYVVLGVAYGALHLLWYGGLTVYAAGGFFAENGGQFSVVGTRPDHLGRSRRLIGLLVDRGFGLSAWQPAWLAVLVAVPALVRRRPPAWLWLLAPLAVGWLVATFVAVTMHGWWFAGRHVLHALPPAVLAIVWWSDAHAPAAARRAVAVAGVVGVWSATWLVAGAVTGNHTIVVDPAGTLDPWFALWSRALPDYLRVTPLTWVLHTLWLAAAAGAAAWVWGGKEGDDTTPPPTQGDSATPAPRTRDTLSP
jgi:hypothetical protein